MKDRNGEGEPAPTGPGSVHVNAFEEYRLAMARKAAAPVRRPVAPAGAALVCGALVAVGSAGPWLRQRSSSLREIETVTGFQSDGIVSLIGAIVAILALVVVLVRPGHGAAAWAALAGLGLSVVVGAANWLFLETAAPGFAAQSRSATFEIAWGLLLVLAAGTIGTLCAALVIRRTD